MSGDVPRRVSWFPLPPEERPDEARKPGHRRAPSGPALPSPPPAQNFPVAAVGLRVTKGRAPPPAAAAS